MEIDQKIYTANNEAATCGTQAYVFGIADQLAKANIHFTLTHDVSGYCISVKNVETLRRAIQAFERLL